METLTQNWRALGHQNLKRILNAHLQSENLPHAYLFVGPAGVGKLDLATEFAEKITGQSAARSMLIHDMAVQSSVDEARELLHYAALTPASGSKSVILIKNMHSASDAVSNVLLKTLEEPSPSAVFLLLSDAVQILPTIMSRCQVMHCSRLSAEDLRDFAARSGIEATDEQVSLAAGSTTRLQALTGHGAEAQAIADIIYQVTSAQSKGELERMILVQQLALVENDVLISALESWAYARAAELNANPKQYTLVRIALETISRLKRNFNKKMTLEYFVTAIA